MTATGAIVSAGMIGDITGGTQLLIGGSIRGIVAAVGSINLSSFDNNAVKSAAFYGGNLGNPNAGVVESLFLGSFDVTPGDLQGLLQMLSELSALYVAPGGILIL